LNFNQETKEDHEISSTSAKDIDKSDGEAAVAWADGVVLEDGEERGGHDDEHAGELEAQAQPAVGGHVVDVDGDVVVEVGLHMGDEGGLGAERADPADAAQAFAEEREDGRAAEGIELAGVAQVEALDVEVEEEDGHQDDRYHLIVVAVILEDKFDLT